jgi:hypothetical protein
MSPDDVRLFDKIANNPELRQKWLRDAKELMPEHPAVKEQKILDDATGPLLERINKLEESLASKKDAERYEAERAQLRDMGFSGKRIKELEERMAKVAKEEGIVFDSYAHAAEHLRKLDNALTQSTATFGFDMGIQPTGDQPGQEKWREDMMSTDPKQNPALMSRRERKRYVRKLAQEASEEFKANLGVR